MKQVKNKINGSICNVVEFYLNYVKLQYAGTDASFWVTKETYSALYAEL